MSFAIYFVTEFSSFKINPEPNKYSSNASDPILPMRHNEALGPKVENEDEKDIKNPGPYYPLSKEGLQHLTSIFDKHNS